MSETVLASASEKQVWMDKYFQEYVRDSRFLPYMSDADLNKGGIILTRHEMENEEGKTINIPFIGRLKGQGVTGSQVLDGVEEELTNYNCPIAIDWRRNAVRVPKSTSFKTEINLLNAAKDGLNTWESEKLRDDIIKSMCAVIIDATGTTVNFDAATAANKNTFTAANQDRLLFGSALSNYSATFATAVGNIATTAKVSAANMALAKRMARSADQRIRPFKTNATKGREWFVAFHGARTFRDFGQDATVIAANKDARSREGNSMDDNPLFQDGDLVLNGVIHREVPEIDDYCAAAGFNGIGGSSGDIRPVFMCGAGAVGIAWGQEPTPRTDYLKDYGFRPGVAIEELLGVKKINFNSKQNGMVTAFMAAAADS